MESHLRRIPDRSRVLVLCSVFAAVAACSNDPAAIAPDAAVAPASGPALLAHRWHFGSVHYRDHGHHSMRGSSGVAAAEAEALFGRNGVTILTVKSFRAGDPDHPAGDIERVLVRVLDPSGRQVLLRVFEPRHDERNRIPISTWAQEFRGLGPGFTFQLLISVSGLDRRHVDIVALPSVVVGRRPDLALTALSLPQVLVAGAPTIIAATVSELNGDHGATADCILTVDRVQVDRARGIWVDAGDAVSCAFTYTFQATGTHVVVVRLAEITPADDYTGNNVIERVVTVSAPSSVGTSVSFTASVRSGTFTSLDSFRTRWTDASTGFLFLDSHNYESATGTDQSAMVSGVIGASLTFPLARIELIQSAGGVLIHNAVYTAVPPDFAGTGCIARGVGTGTEFYLCSDALGFTTFTYRRATGTVTYMSDQYLKVWNGSSYDITSYVDNGSTVTTGPVLPFGNAFSFDVRITDLAGTYVISQLVPLALFTENLLEPLVCGTAPIVIPPTTYTANTCTFSSYVFTGVAGSAAGLGIIAPQSGLRATP